MASHSSFIQAYHLSSGYLSSPGSTLNFVFTVSATPQQKRDFSSRYGCLALSQACTGIIVRAPLCAPEQAQQRGGRIELSNTRRGLLSPPQAKTSVIGSWLAPMNSRTW